VGGTKIGGLLGLTLFLPITIFAAIPIRSHPGSQYTLGMALLGFVPWIGIPVLIWGIVTTNLAAIGITLYLLIGQWVVGRELIARGYMD
jgi:hypothetical protein